MSYHYLRNPDAYTIRKEYHTKLEKDYYLVVPTGRLGDEFGDFRASAKAAGGWYSRKYRRVPGGFAFNTRQEAADWAAEAFGESGADGEAGGAESAAEAPPAVRPLYGHTTEATAYKQTVGGKTRAYWLEYKKGKGYRFVSRTVAPRLTKPVMSTYSDGAAAMYLNENGDVRWSGLSLGHGDGSEYLRFLNNFPGIDDRQLCALYDWARVKVAYNKDQAKEPYFEPEYYQNNIEVWGKVVAKAKSIWVDQKKASKLATAPAAPAPEAEKKPEKAADTAKMTRRGVHSRDLQGYQATQEDTRSQERESGLQGHWVKGCASSDWFRLFRREDGAVEPYRRGVGLHQRIQDRSQQCVSA